MVYLGIQNEREWRAFCEQVLRRPGLAGDPRFSANARRLANRAALDVEIEAVFGELDTPAIVNRLETARIANARMRTVQQFAEHPQLAERGRWRDVASSVGPLPATLPPATIAGVEPVMGPIPELGAHTGAILGGLGFDAATIAGWRAAGMV